jgi:hypothetical protein
MMTIDEVLAAKCPGSDDPEWESIGGDVLKCPRCGYCIRVAMTKQHTFQDLADYMKGEAYSAAIAKGQSVLAAAEPR